MIIIFFLIYKGVFMKKIRICCKENEKCRQVKKKLVQLLKKAGFEITNNNPDIVIAIGGDGTFIKSLKENNYAVKPYYIGVNLGTLGFLQEVESEDLEQLVAGLKNNKFHVENIFIQETIIMLSNNRKIKFKSINEIVVRDVKLKVLKVNIMIEDFRLEQFIGDGILVSTPTGSTAYNMSLGGSIIHPSISALQITPLAPLNNKAYRTLSNSVIVPNEMIIKIVPLNGNSIMLLVDGDYNIFHDVKYIQTSLCADKIKLLKYNDSNYWQKVESKFLG